MENMRNSLFREHTWLNYHGIVHDDEITLKNPELFIYISQHHAQIPLPQTHNQLLTILSNYNCTVTVTTPSPIGWKSNLRRFNDVKIIQNMKLQRVSQCKYPGIVPDSNFTWTPQIDQVQKKKTFKTFHSLKRVKRYLDKRSSRLLLYQR